MIEKSIKSVLTCLLLITLNGIMASTIYADAKNDLAGAKALQFEIRNNFSLESFQGSTLSFKKHTSEGFAWRLGLDIYLIFGDDEWTDYREEIVQSATDGNSNRQDIGLRIQGLFYPHPSSGVKLFYGFGPLIGFSHNTSESDNVRPYSDRLRHSESSSHAWEVGMTGVLGVEWFAASNISLLAEYGTDFYYRYTKHTSESVSTYPDEIIRSSRERAYKDLLFAADRIRFGLSVYF